MNRLRVHSSELAPHPLGTSGHLSGCPVPLDLLRDTPELAPASVIVVNSLEGTTSARSSHPTEEAAKGRFTTFAKDQYLTPSSNLLYSLEILTISTRILFD